MNDTWRSAVLRESEVSPTWRGPAWKILVAEDGGYTLSGLTERVTKLSGLIAGLSGTIQGLAEVVGNKKMDSALEEEA